MRIAYLREDIFKVGSLVENVNTGLTGRITRRGANYVIAVSEDNIMFKSWINDIMEAKPPSGVEASKREVGTDSYREYVQALTPMEKVKSFINKNRQ